MYLGHPQAAPWLTCKPATEDLCLYDQGLTEQVTEMTILEINHAVADRHRIFQYIYSQ
jgi:hypothetical protein